MHFNLFKDPEEAYDEIKAVHAQPDGDKADESELVITSYVERCGWF